TGLAQFATDAGRKRDLDEHTRAAFEIAGQLSSTQLSKIEVRFSSFYRILGYYATSEKILESVRFTLDPVLRLGARMELALIRAITWDEQAVNELDQAARTAHGNSWGRLELQAIQYLGSVHTV